MSSPQKKILILAYDYPPYVSVGGIRPKYWAENFHKHNIHCTVITKNWKNLKHLDYPYVSDTISHETDIETENDVVTYWCPTSLNFSQKLLIKYGKTRFKLLRKIYSTLIELLQYLVPVGSKKIIYTTAVDFLKKEKIDLIIATGDPYVLFHYAAKLSKKFDIPWLADYRDPWSYDLKKGFYPLYLYLNFIERRILKNADAVCSVSDYVLSTIPINNKHSKTILSGNGYNEAIFNDIRPFQFNELIITHAGSIYDYHPIEEFFAGVISFIAKYPNFQFKINFIGMHDDARIEKIIQINPSLRNKIITSKSVSNVEIVEVYRKSHVLVLFNNFDVVGTKIFDYFASKRQILFCFEGESTQQAAILKQNAGVIIRDPLDLVQALEKLKDEFEKKGVIACNSLDPSEYTRKVQLDKLANFIHANF